MKTLNLSLMSLCMISLVACGGAKDKVEALTAGIGGGQTQPGPVAGPSLEGKWDSGCISNPLTSGGEGKRRILIQAEGSNLEHNVITYADSECRRAHAEQDGARKGTYSFARAGVVELRMPINDNASALFYFAAAVEGDVLKVGELGSIDSATGEVPTIVLNKEATKAPQGKITLDAGTYTPAAGERGRDLAVSTANVNDAVAQVFVEFLGSNDPMATLSCEADVCKGSNGRMDYVITIKNASSFAISVPAFNVTVNYVKR